MKELKIIIAVAMLNFK